MDLSPIFLNTKTTDETFYLKKKKKKGSFKDPLKRLANMYKVQAQSSAETLLEFNQGQMYC